MCWMRDFAGFVPPPKAPSPQLAELEKKVAELTTQYIAEVAKLGEEVAQVVADRERALTDMRMADDKTQNYKAEME